MSTFTQWISAFRLRTLFLAIAAVVLGSAMSWREGSFSITIFLIALLLAVAIQILANLANDLGDFQKGTDITGKRQGPTRALQSGKITQKEMKRAVVLFVILCVITGLALIWSATPFRDPSAAWIMVALGAACILAALFYTMGKHAYGYRGLGDLFAFLFFGPVPVIGTWFLHTHLINWQPVLPAIGLGLISSMILNINNMRDIDNDKTSGKITLAVKLGLPRAKVYHILMSLTSFTCFTGYNILFAVAPWYRYAYLLVFLLPLKILIEIRHKEGQALDPYLKQTSLAGFLLAVAFALLINV
jgi:1,4-dihydroxy-2-naphthoate octaprenyltransferase